MPRNIDAVVLWVDGADPVFQRQYAAYKGAAEPQDTRQEASARHRASGELKYCLRSLDKNLPWLRKIHLVTNGQLPSGVDVNHSKLNLVLHSDLFPDLGALPTFNSFSIDSVTHRIKGLSERFLRVSDDFLVLTKLNEEDVAGASGRGRYYFGHSIPSIESGEKIESTRFSTLAFNKFLLSTHGIIANHVPFHAPQFRERSVCEEIESEFRRDFTSTQFSKFRDDRNVNMSFVYPHYVAGLRGLPTNHEGRHVDESHNDFRYSYRRFARQALVGNDRKDWRHVIRGAFEDQVQFLNVNDSMGKEPKPEDIRDFHALLGTLLPDPAPFEVDKRN